MKQAWNKDLTKETDARVLNNGIAIKKGLDRLKSKNPGKYGEMKLANLTGRQKGAILSHASGRMKKGQASRMGKKSREFENKVASELLYEHLFLPQQVCDRIAVMNGKVKFIEIKHKGEKLRKKQAEFRELVGEDYIVVEK